MKARGYVRVSTEEQVKQHSPDAQREAILRYYEYKLKPEGFEWAGFYEDPGVSALKPLPNREAGARLCLDSESGDAIVFSRLDRGFRSTKDALDTSEKLMSKGVKLHFLDLGIDLDSYIGKFFFTFMAAVAEMERCRIRERCMEGIRQKKLKLKDRFQWGQPPYGFKWKGPKGKRYWVPDRYTRKIACKFLELAEVHGFSLNRIYWWAVRNNIRQRNGKEISSEAQIHLWITREKALQKQEAKALEAKERRSGNKKEQQGERVLPEPGGCEDGGGV